MDIGGSKRNRWCDVAVNNVSKQIRDFLPHLRRGAAVRIVLLQFVICVTLIASLVLTSTLAIESLTLWIIVGIMFALGVSTGLIIATYVARPTKDLLAAVIHVAGEPTTTTPPNPSEKRYTKNGFAQALQTIYELAGHEDNKFRFLF